MAIERSILENIQRAASEGDWKQIGLAQELAENLKSLGEVGFIDYPVDQHNNRNIPDVLKQFLSEASRERGVANIHLTPAEFRLLTLLVFEHPDTIIACSTIEEKVLQQHNVSDDAVKQIVLRTRNKVEVDPSKPARIITFRSRGYAFLTGNKPINEIVEAFDNHRQN